MEVPPEVPVFQGEVRRDDDLVPIRGPKDGTIVPDTQRDSIRASGRKGATDLFDQRQFSSGLCLLFGHSEEDKWQADNPNFNRSSQTCKTLQLETTAAEIWLHA
jgi:hypothetical protein